jgi:cytochrome d ubiquinol oxidase subunit I
VVGNVVGPLMGYEVLTAFFLEATFLGIMLFGWNRVPPWLHIASAIAVAVGTLSSAFWILSANSWMQYPTGHEVRDGIAYPVDWIAIVFSPTFPLRLAHMVMAAYLTTAFVVIAVGARFALAGKHRVHAGTMLRMGIGMAAILAPLQVFLGDQHGLKVAEYQPAKLAAIEGHWDSSGPAPLVLFAIPNPTEERNDLEIAIPHGGSLLITHSFDGTFPGLKDFAPEDRPNVYWPFFAFRIMVGIGFAMVALSFWGIWLWWRKRLESSPAFLHIAAWSWPFGFIAILSGWTVAETGRQPWLATGILRTVDAASPVPAEVVATSLVLFVIVYAVVFAAGLVYMNRLIVAGPAVEPAPVEGVPNRPISAAAEAGKQVIGGEG